MIMRRRYAWKETPFPFIDETAFPVDGIISAVDECSGGGLLYKTYFPGSKDI
jgi:hypothetical protein